MDHFERIFKMHRLLKQSRYPISRKQFEEKLKCTRATVKRIMNELKIHLGAPLEYDSRQNGYYYAQDETCLYELPGLWFNATELHALLSVQHLLKEVQPGMLESQIAPFQKRIQEILKSKYMGKADITRNVRILGMGVRSIHQENFQAVAGALAAQQQINITYHSRSKNQKTERKISPQRLIHYRDNWYLDAWDHQKSALRSFAIDRIQKTSTLKQKAKTIPDRSLDEQFTTAYGIFSGKPKYTAQLRFTPECSRWVAEEIWHPQQKGAFKDGYYILQIPYADTRELVMDILKYGPKVEVLEPEGLRKEIKQLLQKTLKKY
ncbi:transcriptional regulator [bacterium]|nr:transcriptional regulator [bacterium]